MFNICHIDIIFREKMEKKQRTVIHLEINNKHEYFGSIANMFEYYNPLELGITYGSLRNFSLAIDNPYINSKCIIRKGILLAKNSNRGNFVK